MHLSSHRVQSARRLAMGADPDRLRLLLEPLVCGLLTMRWPRP